MRRSSSQRNDDDEDLTGRLLPINSSSIIMMSDTMDEPTGVWREVTGTETLEEEEEVFQPKRILPWNELKRIEKKRRDILTRSEMPFYKILSFWDGTCLKALGSAPLLWITLSIYIFCRIQIRLGDNVPGFMRDLGDTDLDVIGGFLSFFLVIYVNQSNLRFNEMYKLSMACSGKIFDVAQLVSDTLPKANALRIVRYLNAAHTAGYVGLTKTYSKDEFFNYLNRAHCFLSPHDLNRISELHMDHGPDVCHEILQWCIMDLTAARKAGHLDAREAGTLKDKVLQFRGHMGSLYDYCDQPIHFFYIHFLVLLATCYLPLFAIDSAYNAGSGDDIHIAADILNGLIVILQSVFVIGLRLLGQKMVDPYGDDMEDLSVLHYIKETWQKSNRILAAQHPGEVDPPVEERLVKEMVSIGQAWEPKKETGMKAV